MVALRKVSSVDAERTAADAEHDLEYPLQSITCTFVTLDSPKGSEMSLHLTIDNGEALLGSSTIPKGVAWQPGSEVEICVSVASAVDYFSSEHGHLIVTTDAQVDTEWRFNATLHLCFEEGGWRKVAWNNVSLGGEARTAPLYW
jgi:hypothetical protein